MGIPVDLRNVKVKEKINMLTKEIFYRNLCEKKKNMEKESLILIIL